MDLFEMYIDWETCLKKPEGHSDGKGEDQGDNDPDEAVEGGDDDDFEDRAQGADDKNSIDADHPPDPTSLSAHRERLLRLEHFHAFIAETGKYVPKPSKDNFAPLDPKSARISIKNETTAFILTARITYRKQPIDVVSEMYNLPRLLDSILSFYGSYLPRHLPFSVLDCWNKVYIQLHTYQDASIVAPPYTVAAFPPTDTLPFGFCNFVLVKDPPDAPYRGIQCGDNSACFYLKSHAYLQLTIN